MCRSLRRTEAPDPTYPDETSTENPNPLRWAKARCEHLRWTPRFPLIVRLHTLFLSPYNYVVWPRTNSPSALGELSRRYFDRWKDNNRRLQWKTFLFGRHYPPAGGSLSFNFQLIYLKMHLSKDFQRSKRSWVEEKANKRGHFNRTIIMGSETFSYSDNLLDFVSINGIIALNWPNVCKRHCQNVYDHSFAGDLQKRARISWCRRLKMPHCSADYRIRTLVGFAKCSLIVASLLPSSAPAKAKVTGCCASLPAAREHKSKRIMSTLHCGQMIS